MPCRGGRSFKSFRVIVGTVLGRGAIECHWGPAWAEDSAGG